MKSAVCKTGVALCALFMAAAALNAAAESPAVKDEAAAKPQIEVAFVLDTTGSMGGLIEGAKQKIWAIANQMVSAKPTPRLKLGLIGYRDRGDAYVTKVFDLSEDIDAVYANLQKFQADGGGDTPESVNEALSEAVNKLSWNPDRNVLKIVFLVGDAPPHMDYPNQAKFPEICQSAVKKDLIINTIQCGAMTETTPVWQEIARLSEGSYVAIGQTGDMQIVSTPFDAKLGELNAEMGSTVVAWGVAEKREEVHAKVAVAKSMALPAAADRLAYASKTGEVVGGGGDLVDAVDKGEVKVEALKEAELPAELRDMDQEKRDEFVKEKGKKRKAIQTEIDDLVRKRQAYIDAENKKLAASGSKDSFDAKVFEIIKGQAARKGISYSELP